MPSFTQSVRQRTIAGEAISPTRSPKSPQFTPSANPDIWHSYFLCYASVFGCIIFSVFFYINLSKIPYWIIAIFGSRSAEVMPINSGQNPMIIPPSSDTELYLLHEPESVDINHNTQQSEIETEVESENDEDIFSHEWGRINSKKDLSRQYGHTSYTNDWDMYQLPFSSDLVTKSRDREKKFDIGTGVSIVEGQHKNDKGEVIADENGLWRIALGTGGEQVLVESSALGPLPLNETYELIWSRGWGCFTDLPKQCSSGPDSVDFDAEMYAPHYDSYMLIWVPFRYLSKFVEQVVPKYGDTPFTLLTSDGTDQPPKGELTTFQSDFVSKLLATKSLQYWYTANYCPKVLKDDVTNKTRCVYYDKDDIVDESIRNKILPLPSGLHFEGSPHPLYKTDSLYHHIHGKKNKDRDVKILSLHSNEKDAKLMSILLPDYLSTVEIDSKLTQEQRFKKHREFAFYAHPRFDPSDAWRIWDALTLGCIVIVQSSPLDTLYEEFPVVIVKDWSDITNATLYEWHDYHKGNTSDRDLIPKLRVTTWLEKIRSKDPK